MKSIAGCLLVLILCLGLFCAQAQNESFSGKDNRFEIDMTESVSYEGIGTEYLQPFSYMAEDGTFIIVEIGVPSKEDELVFKYPHSWPYMPNTYSEHEETITSDAYEELINAYREAGYSETMIHELLEDKNIRNYFENYHPDNPTRIVLSETFSYRGYDAIRLRLATEALDPQGSPLFYSEWIFAYLGDFSLVFKMNDIPGKELEKSLGALDVFLSQVYPIVNGQPLITRAAVTTLAGEWNGTVENSASVLRLTFDEAGMVRYEYNSGIFEEGLGYTEEEFGECTYTYENGTLVLIPVERQRQVEVMTYAAVDPSEKNPFVPKKVDFSSGDFELLYNDTLFHMKLVLSAGSEGDALSWMEQVTPAPVEVIDQMTGMGEGIYRSAYELQPLGASLIDKMATRSGPGTQYTEEHTYSIDTPIALFEQEMGGSVPWGMVELRVEGGMKRVYTGMKRIRTNENVPWANTESTMATVGTDVVPLFGPGRGYLSYKDDQVLPAGTSVEIFHEENGYVMADFKLPGEKRWIRAWLPLSCLADYQSIDYMVWVTPTPAPTPVPTPTPIPKVDVVSMSMGGNHSGFVDVRGNLWLMGWNEFGQIGVGSKLNNVTSPRKVLSDIVQVSCGFYHTMALDSSGLVYAWGRSNKGQVGNGKTGVITKPVRLKLSGITSIAAGDEHCTALTEDGLLYTWGCNEKGQLGLGTTDNQKSPKLVDGINDIVDIGAGDYNTAVILSDGSLWVTGDNSCGQLGQNGSELGSTFVKVELPEVIQVEVGDYHIGAVTANGDLYLWGSNEYGQLGDWQLDQTSTPTLIMQDVEKIILGDYHTFAIKTDGSLWAWGRNHLGQLGNGETMDVVAPTQVRSNVVAIQTGFAHTSVLLEDNTILGWGRNKYGQLGLGRLSEVVNPTQIAPMK